MTTSGTTTTQLTRNLIVASAMRKVGALATGQTPLTEDYTNVTEAINNVVARFQTLGMPLWARKTYDVTMVASQSTYTIGVGLAVNTAYPLKVLQAWTEPSAGGARQELERKSVYDYNLLPINDGATGTPSSFMYQPFINYGELNLWPAPDNSAATTRTLTINYMAPFEDFVSAGDTPYFPKEWNDAIIYATAVLIAPEYGVPIQDRSDLKKEAKEYLDTALDFGTEEASLYFQPEARW